ncbi:hypothetical protein GPEL0_01r4330 [Geoanaerobacter pelophilus]|uniref:Uncharacterized protein n=1 Tax=Geoanaerobacter pelophilus TaxID=60036 RepID=A0ABQ0MM33_9BACT|nr:hypothetical protein GPEL0_01r4330 [Geoanaerobacter pelophilus]
MFPLLPFWRKRTAAQPEDPRGQRSALFAKKVGEVLGVRRPLRQHLSRSN